MMNKTMQSNIEKNVMRRVHIIHTLRPIISFGALSALLAILALMGIGREVWVARVFENMLHTGDFATLSRFWLVAFENTRMTVQALTLLTLASVVYFAREATRVATAVLTPARV